MAIVYCDWATGDDTNGNGSYSNPYKTITKATTGRTGGDEIRVGKSPDPTPLTGTVGFTEGSTAVTGVNTLFTTELAIGDFIEAPDGEYYEVVTITSDTAAVLFKVYPSATQSGYSSKKLGVTDTGAAASSATQVQIVSSSGTSSANLVISGGWNLATQTQTGQTYFRQMHSTFANRYGYGLYLSGKTFTDISRLHFLRYRYGIYYNNGSNFNILNLPVCHSNGFIGIDYSNSHCNILISPVCNFNDDAGVDYWGGSANNILISPICNSNAKYGIHYNTNCNNNIVISPTFNSNGQYGVRYSSKSSNNFCYGTLTTANNYSGSINIDSGIDLIHIVKANLSEATKFSGAADYLGSRLFIDDLNGTGNAYIYTDNGNIQSRNATAGGTGKEWVLSPTSNKRGAKYPLNLSVAKVAVAGSGQVTVKLYFKKTGTGVAGALRVRYGQINWSNDAEDIIVNCPDNTNRNQVTLQFTPTEAGVVEIEALAWYVSSTTQSVIVDDIDISQA
jgi:hypothetical protein